MFWVLNSTELSVIIFTNVIYSEVMITYFLINLWAGMLKYIYVTYLLNWDILLRNSGRSIGVVEKNQLIAVLPLSLCFLNNISMIKTSGLINMLLLVSWDELYIFICSGVSWLVVPGFAFVRFHKKILLQKLKLATLYGLIGHPCM